MVMGGGDMERGRRALASVFTQAFSLRATRGLSALLMEGSGALQEFEKAITGTNMAFQMEADQLQTIQGQWGILLQMWERARIVLGEAMNPALRTAIGLLQFMAQTALDSGLFRAIGGLAGMFMGVVNEASAALAGPLMMAVNELVARMPKVVAALGGAIEAALPSIMQLLDILPSLITDSLADIITAIGNFTRVAGPLFVQWVAAVGPALTGIFVDFVNAVTGFLQSNGQTLIQWFQSFLEWVGRLVQQLPSVLPLIATLLQQMMEALPILLQGFINNLPVMVKLFDDFLKLIGRFAQDYFPLLVYVLQELLKVIAMLLKDFGPPLIGLFERLVPEIEKMVAALERALIVLTEIMAQIAAAWATKLPEVIEHIVELFDGLGGSITKILRLLLTLGKAFVILKAWEVWLKLIKLLHFRAAQEVMRAAKEIAGGIDDLMKRLGDIEKRAKPAGKRGERREKREEKRGAKTMGAGIGRTGGKRGERVAGGSIGAAGTAIGGMPGGQVGPRNGIGRVQPVGMSTNGASYTLTPENATRAETQLAALRQGEFERREKALRGLSAPSPWPEHQTA